jgi:hypothetical protein
MPIMESAKTESTTMTDGEMILWLVTKGTMEDKPVLHFAADRVQALLAEREELVECNEQFSVDNQFLKKRVEKAEADNARLTSVVARFGLMFAGSVSVTQEDGRIVAVIVPPKGAVSHATLTGKADT